jgi:hypothetical protein
MGDARGAAFAANAAARGLPDRRSSPLVAGQAAAVAQVVDLGAAAYAIRAVGAADPPVRLGRHASANETGSEKDSPRRLENWSSMTSEVEARSAGA